MGKIRVCGGGEVEGDQESTGSLRYVATAPQNQWGNGVAVNLHSQILRIREEDSLIGEDTVEVFSKYLCCIDDKHRHVASVIVFSKPMLPASPLRESTAVMTPD